MFDISLGELAVIGVAAYFVLGPQQVKFMARLAGKGTGRAVGFVGRARIAVEGVITNPELKGINNELSSSFQEFALMRRELQSATMNPVDSFKTAIMGSAMTMTSNNSVANAGGSAAPPTSTSLNPQPTFASSFPQAATVPGQQWTGPSASLEGSKNIESGATSVPVGAEGGAAIVVATLKERALLLKLEQLSTQKEDQENGKADT